MSHPCHCCSIALPYLPFDPPHYSFCLSQATETPLLRAQGPPCFPGQWTRLCSYQMWVLRCIWHRRLHPSWNILILCYDSKIDLRMLTGYGMTSLLLLASWHCLPRGGESTLPTVDQGPGFLPIVFRSTTYMALLSPVPWKPLSATATEFPNSRILLSHSN